MSEKKTYEGSCHCGKVRYKATFAMGNVIGCNCSMCRRAGTLLAFVPETDFQLVSGENEQTDYTFNKHAIHHTFCKTCGIKSFARAIGPQGPAVAINVRCLDGVDPDALSVTKYDGASH